MPPQIDYSLFDTPAIKSQLSSRGLSIEGPRPQLVKRLRKEVNKAWRNYNKSATQQPLFPQQSRKPKSPKPKKTPEQIKEEQEASDKKRQEKYKRRAEHEERVEEARERKRLKKEESAKKQAVIHKQQKQEKEQRQMSEAFLGFDLRSFEEQVRKRMDPSGSNIASISYETVSKRFRIKFNTAAQAQKVTKGITMKKQKKLNFDSSVFILPSPVESQCVMFLYPMSTYHPDSANAKKWCDSKGLGEEKDSIVLQSWIASALSTFSKFGTVVNIYRERGFLVVHFASKAHASKMLGNAKDFNGCSFIHLQTGTPTKLDKRTVTARATVREALKGTK